MSVVFNLPTRNLVVDEKIYYNNPRDPAHVFAKNQNCTQTSGQKDESSFYLAYIV